MIEQKGETYIWSTVEDISQDKKAELELMQSEERFRTTFENSASGMCMTGLEGELVQVNARMCEMLEYPAAELVGKHFNSITLPEDSEIGQDIVSRMLAGEINSAAFEKRYLTRSGRTIWVVSIPPWCGAPMVSPGISSRRWRTFPSGSSPTTC